VLVVASDLPVAVRSGSAQRVRAVTRALAMVADVHLHSICHRRVEGSPPWPGVVGWSTSSDPAMGPRRPVGSDTAWVRDPAGHPSDSWLDPSAAADLRVWLDAFGPDAIVLAGLSTSPYLEVAREHGVPVVLDHQNVEADLAEEIAALEDTAPRVMMRRLVAQRTVVRESSVVAAVNRVWAVSPRDGQRLTERYPISAPVDVVPNVLDELPPEPRPPSQRPTPLVLYPAAFGFAPNLDAARWLVRQFLPAVKPSIPGATLVLAGSDPPVELTEHQDRAVSVTGSIPDMSALFGAATMMPVPLRAGSGTRIKILEALAHRVPVITTAKGCAGLDVEDGIHLMVEDDLDRWAQKAIALHRYTSTSDQMTADGRRLVEQMYSLDALVSAVAHGLGQCLSSRGSTN
jgi:glycosyltransferase involved in cell wall biosynthesis